MKEPITYAIDNCSKQQDVIAKEMGVTQQTVSDWRTGKTAPRINKLEKLARVCGVSPTWLIAGVGAMYVEYSEADLRKSIKEKLENADIPTLIRVDKSLSSRESP